MPKTIIQELVEFGQSVWLDYISRSLIESGKLNQLINMGLRGMTSNPTIFEKTISLSDDYDAKIKECKKINKSTFEIYDVLTVKDIQDAADAFRPIYEQTNGLDGFVSLEISPRLAYNTKETIKEGKRLYKKVNRPNLMLKVPSTDEGFPAVSALLAEGINVNITLIFSLQQYLNTAEAYVKGIEQCLQNGGDVKKIRSVASVFVSRIDTSVDKILAEKMTKERTTATKEKIELLRGKSAVANSGIIFGKYREMFFGNAFKDLQNKGANIQRLLWGSTSTKNPVYNDIKYISELIGKDTINTIPEKTLNAFLDHGAVKEALTPDINRWQQIINDLREIGIHINEVCMQLLDDGVKAFEKSFNSLLASIDQKAGKL